MKFVFALCCTVLTRQLVAQDMGSRAEDVVSAWSAQFRPQPNFEVEWLRSSTARDPVSGEAWPYECAEVGRYQWPDAYIHHTEVLTDVNQNFMVLGGVKPRMQGVLPDGRGFATESGNELIWFLPPTTLAQDVWKQSGWAPWLLAAHFAEPSNRANLVIESETVGEIVLIETKEKRRLHFEQVEKNWRLVRIAALNQNSTGEDHWTVFSDFRRVPELGTEIAHKRQSGARSLLRKGEVINNPPMTLVRLEFVSSWPESAFALDTDKFSTVDVETGELIAPGGLRTGIIYGPQRASSLSRVFALSAVIFAMLGIGFFVWRWQSRRGAVSP